jgi:hypothetical protein
MEDFALKEISRNRVIRMLRYKSTRAKIETYRQTLKVMRLKLNIPTEGDIMDITAQREEVLGKFKTQAVKEHKEHHSTNPFRQSGPFRRPEDSTFPPTPSSSNAIPTSTLNPGHQHSRPEFLPSRGNIGNKNILEAPNHITSTTAGNSTSITIQQSPWSVVFILCVCSVLTTLFSRCCCENPSVIGR